MRSLLLGAALCLFGCTREPECADHTECVDGKGCVEGQCKQVDCLLSIDCPIESYCDPESFECTPGCQYSDDCLTTDRCDPVSATCQPRHCSDTQRDCQPGELCNRGTGECYEDPTPHCERCSSPSECGEGDCWSFEDYGAAYCFYPCNPEAAEPCPASYQCTRVNDVQYACLTYCPFLE